MARVVLKYVGYSLVKYQLIVIDEHRHSVHDLHPERKAYVVGRVETSDIVIKSRLLTHHHCRIYWEENYICWFLSTFNPTNPVFVNGIVIKKDESHELVDGDTHSFGDTVRLIYQEIES